VAEPGPCPPGPEPLSGLYLLEAAGLDDAIRLAGRLPAARLGRVEIRKVVN
jgi:hypothetical protein